MTLFLPVAIAICSPSRAAPAPPSENEALHECRRYPPDKRFEWKLRGQVDLPTLVDAIAPMLCRPVIIPGSLRPVKVTILAPATLTAADAYRMFLSSLETMGLTIEPEGKVLKVIDSRWARQTAIPTYTGDAPARDQFVTRLLHLDNVTAAEVKPVLDRLHAWARRRHHQLRANEPSNGPRRTAPGPSPAAWSNRDPRAAPTCLLLAYCARLVPDRDSPTEASRRCAAAT